MDESAREESKVLKREIYHPYINTGRWDNEESELPSVSGFTKGKEYPIYEEKQLNNRKVFGPFAFVYITEDDEGKIRTIPSAYFTSKVVIKDNYIDEKFLEGQPVVEDLRKQGGKLDIMYQEGRVQSSGIPYAVMHFQEMLKEAEDFKYLAGVKGHQSEILEKIMEFEEQMEKMCVAIRSLRELAIRTYSTERKE